MLDIARKVSGMSEEQLQERLKEMQQQAKDLDDLGLNPNAGFQFEAMMILAKQGVMSAPQGFDECTPEIDDALLED